jgi:tRNA pseudouridine65 synthase
VQLRILYQDESIIAVDKPAGFHVHPPEDTRHKIPKMQNTLFVLGRQIDAKLYPVHRLDRATSGVLVFALSSESASGLARQFGAGTVEKTYYAVTRGWTEDRGEITHPLKAEHDETLLRESLTEYETIGRIELPVPVAPHPTSRYSLVRVHPRTGRMHQIRRHFRHLSHPLIGDSIYGDNDHNKLFRERLGGRALLLKAQEIRFTHPMTGEAMRITGKWNQPWHQLFDLFGLCPAPMPPAKSPV